MYSSVPIDVKRLNKGLWIYDLVYIQHKAD
jgi:hypothetical protein